MLVRRRLIPVFKELQVTVQAIAYVALGANLGDAGATVLKAMGDIGTLPTTTLLNQSSLYCTAPVAATGPDYVNAVVEITTGLSPQGLLHELQQLELRAGRERAYQNAPRTLDLDILLYGNVCLNGESLVIPHPRMYERAFVLHPLAEIAPSKVSAAQLHAVCSQTIRRMRDG